MQYFFINNKFLAQNNILPKNPHVLLLAGISPPTQTNAKWNNSVLLDTTDLILHHLSMLDQGPRLMDLRHYLLEVRYSFGYNSYKYNIFRFKMQMSW